MGDPFSAGVTEAAPPKAPDDGGAPTAGSSSSSADGSGTAGMTHDMGATTALQLDAAISGFDPSELQAKEGKIRLTIHNPDAFGHDFTIDELGVKVTIDANATVTTTFDAKPGLYTFYCSIPGHRDAGMEGTLTVLPGAGH
jgi:uncharacterized cupredoxin-like copper-binding protein